MAGPTYTYTLCTPDSASPMNQTQPLILGNFEAINELISVNHVTFNLSDSGKHNYLSMPNTTDPSTTDTEIDMYTKVTGSPNPCELYIRYPNDGEVIQISYPASSVTPIGTSGGNGAQGWCSFSSGILLRWGTIYTAGAVPGGTYIQFTSGPVFTVLEFTSLSAPTNYGATTPTGLYTASVSDGQPIVTGFYGYTSSTVYVNFNYLLIGM